ncbi:MAG: lipocalin family protein [Lachnospiraceae bacterium]|nr:lipocalin family protein [Robinsoniella sp.]MDY3765318.1 lipocalin family protein [Lachnospiraceae bacterium]
MREVKKRTWKIKWNYIAAIFLTLSLLTACSGIENELSGSYSFELLGTTTTYQFSKNEVTVKTSLAGIVASKDTGTYKINGDTITLEFNDPSLSGTFSFEKSQNEIEIGGIILEKD